MTCIVACIENGKAYIAGDRMGSDTFSKMESKRAKVFKKNGFLFGYTTSFRMGQIIEYSFEIPERGYDEPLDYYIYTKFVNSLRKCFDKNGFGGTDSKNNTGDVGGSFIFIVDNRIFEMQDDFAILEHSTNFCSVGAGQFHAIAAMEALKHTNMKPKEKLRESIRIASKFVVSVSETCDIISL